jgi:protein-arginine kinase activator protein McsA
MARKRKPDRLDREAKAATDAEMSYGKWKAMQPREVIVPPVPKNRVEMKCQRCCNTFYQFDKRNRKYCQECLPFVILERQSAYKRRVHQNALSKV